jgi:membrane protease YdiL (CAAX protease family)
MDAATATGGDRSEGLRTTAWLVVAALVVAALVPVTRLPVLVALVLGLAVAGRRRRVAWPIAAGIPVAVNQAWGTMGVPAPAALLADCANLLSPPALWRVAEAALVIGVVGILAVWLGSRPRELGLVRPSRDAVALALLGAVVVAGGSLLLGSAFAAPFFGSIKLRLSDPMALAPALMLALANGTMEELIYRGALFAWLGRAIGPRAALAAQAVVFGVAHGGADFVASPVPVMVAVGIGGVIAGLIVRRTGSLAFPIAIHVAFDVPLHYAIACRLP